MRKKSGKLFKGLPSEDNVPRPFEEGDAEALIAKAEKLLQKGRYIQAIECLNQAATIKIRLNHKKEAIITLNKMGKICNEVGKYSRAAIFHEQAVALDRELKILIS